jgi:UDPglucose 6-dehydrogenase
MKIAVVGTGYVGLVAGTCFADVGHSVTCVDTDASKISQLREGRLPIYEPGLEDILALAIQRKRIHFTTSLEEAVKDNQVIFVAVGTPEGPDGNPVMEPVLNVVDGIARHSQGAKRYIVLKSTVPVGTAAMVQARLDHKASVEMEVVNNPEFLKEGAAVDDFLKPDRVVVGCRSPEARAIMQELYEPFVKNGHPIFFMDNASAELTKYAANAFLSVKISFVNELAQLADRVGADINDVRRGFTSDRRINPAFFYPGIGYGGSCFPKDVQALIKTGHKFDVPMKVVEAADEVNNRQRDLMFAKIQKHFGGLKGKKIALWGLSFKPRTDDVREAPALALIENLVKAGASVTAFDPVATENATKACGVSFAAVDSQTEAVKGADALVICTEWNEFRSPDLTELKGLLKSAVIFDGRNILDPAKVHAAGFKYYCFGRETIQAGPRA